MALRSFREGDRVKAAVLSIDTTTRRISFGLKPSYFSEDDFAAVDEESGDEVEPESLGVVEDESDGDEEDEGGDASEEDASEGEEDGDIPEGSVEDDDDEMQVDSAVDLNPQFKRNTNKPTASIPTLELGGGFQWSAQPSQEYDEISASSEDEDAEDTQHGKKKKRRKEIEQDLTADLHTKAPESNADFERLLLGSPNSSYLWVQYMSFQLQLSEIDKARDIARRALRTINFREEQEKLNIWIALLNIENVYGTEET